MVGFANNCNFHDKECWTRRSQIEIEYFVVDVDILNSLVSFYFNPEVTTPSMIFFCARKNMITGGMV